MPTKTTPGSSQAQANAEVALATGPTRLALRLAWARQVLNAPVNATPAEVRSRFLAGVAAEEFVPGEAWHQAYLTLADDFSGVTDVTEPAEFLRDEASSLYDAIDQFSRRMFSLSVEQREREFNELWALALPHSTARARLEGLSAGVSVNTGVISAEAPLMFELVGYLVELFPLRPAEKAARRAEITEALFPEIDKWETAARIFKTQQPRLAALDETLLDRLANWSRVEKQIARQSVNLERPIITTSTTRPLGSAGNNSIPWYAFVIGFFVISGLVRMASTVGTSSSSYPRYSSPSYPSQPFNSPQVKSSKELDELLKKLRSDAKRYELRPPGEADEKFLSPTLSHEELRRILREAKPRESPPPVEAPEEPRLESTKRIP